MGGLGFEVDAAVYERITAKSSAGTWIVISSKTADARFAIRPAIPAGLPSCQAQTSGLRLAHPEPGPVQPSSFFVLSTRVEGSATIVGPFLIFRNLFIVKLNPC